MPKRGVRILLALLMLYSSMSISPASAEQDELETYWQRTGDWLAMLGKNTSEKKLILARRNARRARDRKYEMAREANR